MITYFWHPQETRFSVSTGLVVGKVVVGSYGYNHARAKSDDDSNTYSWRSQLPSLVERNASGVASTEAACAEALLRSTHIWLRAIGALGPDEILNEVTP